jgi:uncharacterized protein YchJ
MRRALRRGPLQMITALAIFAVGGAAFTAVNTVPQTSAGEGANTISGFTITNITYNLDPANPSNITSVDFTATANNGDGVNTALSIYSEFVNGSGDWYLCTRGGGVPPAHDITCDTSPANPNTAVQLTATAANNFTAVIAEQ